MSNNRRGFIKSIAVAGAALTLPALSVAADNEIVAAASGVIPKTWLFQGDSITDGGRSYDHDWNHVYGQDYAYLIAGRMNFDYPENDYQIFNRGISGNTVRDLADRWQKDALDLKPDLLSILVGVNDVFGVIVKGSKATADDFSNTYDELLTRTTAALPGVQLILMEPFILPLGMVAKDPATWVSEIVSRQAVVKQLAEKHNAIFVPLQDAFNKATLKAPADHWIWDGVHPMPAGHELMARQWLKVVGKHIKIS